MTVHAPGKPKLGEVWWQEQPNLSRRLYLVVNKHRHELESPVGLPVVHEQHVLLDLESGKVRRVNVRSFHSANGWSRFRHRANKGTGLEGGKRTKKK